jgi:hypothetical protein
MNKNQHYVTVTTVWTSDTEVIVAAAREQAIAEGKPEVIAALGSGDYAIEGIGGNPPWALNASGDATWNVVTGALFRLEQA